MKKIFTLRDLSFYDDKSSSKYWDSQFIQWDRSPNVGDVVFFTDLCLNQYHLPQYKNSKKIGWLVEPEVISESIYNFIKWKLDDFDLVLTHHKKYLDLGKNIKYYPFGGSWIKEENWKEYKKSKNICMMVSDKTSTVGHQLRHMLAQKIIEKSGNVEFYGTGTNNKPKDKYSFTKDFKFEIVVENCQENGYFTEKLIDAFATHTIPLYWGDPEISEYFNINGIIQINSEKDVWEILNSDLNHIYQSRLQYLKENHELAKKYRVAEDWFFQEYFRV